MAESTGTYTVRFKRIEDGWWLARVKEVPGVLTDGRTLAATRRRIREALATAVDDAWEATLVEEYPQGVVQGVRAVRRARERALEASAAARTEMRRAVRRLADLGLSLRDAADLLGVSHQRVMQLSRSERNPGAR